MKTVVDLNSIVTGCLFSGKDDENAVITDEGEFINSAEFGYHNFLNRFRQLLQDFDIQPVDIIACMDGIDSRKVRRTIFPAYKAHREKRSDEFYKQLKKCTDLCTGFIRSLGGLVVTANGYEADDLCYLFANRMEATTVSRDKDLVACSGNFIFLSNKGFIPMPAGTTGHLFHGIPDRHVPLYRTLVGDSGDNIPGVKGFGEKAFLKLLETFGIEGLDALMELFDDGELQLLQEDVGELPALQKILDDIPHALLMWKICNAVDVPDKKLLYRPGYPVERDHELFDPYFDEYYQNVTLVTADNFKEICEEIRKIPTEFMALDIETTVGDKSDEWLAALDKNLSRNPIGVDVFASQLVGLSITLGRNLNHTYYFSVGHADTNNVYTTVLRDFITSLPHEIVCHNAGGFELPVLKLNWGVWLKNCYCSQIAANYVDENEPTGLKMLSKRYFGYNQTSYGEVTGGRKMHELTAEHVLSYGADDTVMTAALMNFFITVMTVEGSLDAYFACEVESMLLIADSFVRGIPVDLDVLEKLAAEDEARYKEAMETITDCLIADGRWPGCQFEPVDKLDAKGIKALAKGLGQTLTTRFRVPAKVAALVEDETLRDLILAEDLDGANTYVAGEFNPVVDFKVNSAVQKSKLLYEIMGLECRYFGELTAIMKKAGRKKGNPKADADCVKWTIKDLEDRKQTLEEMIDGASGEELEDLQAQRRNTMQYIEVCKALLTAMACLTRQSLFYHPYPYLVHWKDGRLHPSMRQSSTTSRRFAPSGPNVNQMPKRSEEGKKIRGCIVPHHEDAVIVSCDYSGQELRIGSQITQDENFLKCYINDGQAVDVHSLTGFEIDKMTEGRFNSIDEFLEAKNIGDKYAKDTRTIAKPVNFLSQYASPGSGSWNLSKRLQIPEEQAQLFIEAKSKAFPGVDTWKVEEGLRIRERGYATTILGARRHVYRQLCNPRYDDKALIRSALNFEIQSSSAEMTKMTLSACWEAGLLDKYDCQFYFPVHDEVVFSVAKKDLNDFLRELRQLMLVYQEYVEVPLDSDAAVGPNFGELEDMKWPED